MRNFCFFISWVCCLMIGSLSGLLVPVTAASVSDTNTVYLPLIVQGSSTNTSTSPVTLDQFVGSVTNGQPGVVRGVYADAALALEVIQQPANNAGYIESRDGVATQFQLASPFGVIGLLAHNNLAGSQYFELEAGEEVDIVYGDGTVIRYRVLEIQQYQALDPYSATSRFVDLASGENISAAELFVRVYTTPNRVTFQTCIARDGISSWGRYFVIAEPIS